MYRVDRTWIRHFVQMGLTPAVWILILLLSLWLRILVPPFVVPAPADDGLMVNLANSLLRGEWLGQWNFLTLAKAPGYAIFSSASAYVGLPVTVTVHFLYLAGVVLAALLVRGTFSARLSTITLLFLAFNPVMFGTESSRIYRDGLITALILISISLSGLLGFQLLNPLRKRMDWVLALAFGLSLGFVYITKIDALLYTFPAALLVFLGSAVTSGRSLGNSRIKLHKALIIGISSLLGLALSPLLVLGMNVNYYNLPVIEDTINGPIPALLTSLSSIDVGRNSQYVAVSELQRQKAYEVSPAASKLKPFLDPDFQGMSRSIDPCTDAGICQTYFAPPTWRVGIWRDLSCVSNNICDEASTWFLWNLRDALMLASGTDPERFYGIAASASAEIDSACTTGRIACSSAFIPSLGNSGNIRFPPLDNAILPAIIESFRFSGADQGRPDLGLAAMTPQDWEFWVKFTTWYSPTDSLTPSATAKTVITVLQKSYAITALVLFLPAFIGFGLTIVGVYRRRRLALISCGFAAGWLLQVLMLAFLDVNQGNYISEIGQYLLHSSSLLILFLVTSTWLLITAFKEYFETGVTKQSRGGKRGVDV